MANLDPKIKAQMINSATEARRHSHSPYSGFKVGASVLMDDGKVYGGCNVENASYGGTVCAERVAIWKAVSEGAKKIAALVVVTDSDQPWPPCGMCRQVVSEFAEPAVPVILANLKGKEIAQTVGELCPHFFGPLNLK